MPAPVSLTSQEREILGVLVEHRGRVVGRPEIARKTGLAVSQGRRCDRVLVRLRDHLGSNSIITVRSRGWMLSADAVGPAIELLVGSARS